jgi:flagellar assembly protein FliH
MAGQGKFAGGEIETLEYPACPGDAGEPEWDGWVEADEEEAAEQARGSAKNARAAMSGGAMDEGTLENERRSFEAGRERGRGEGREAQAAAVAAEADRYKRQLAVLVARFAEERDRYLNAVEQEVVKLALAVAARILRREAQMDPLLLTGAVRVALGQLAASSEVRLRVPEAELKLWTEAISHVPNLALKPVVEPGEGMRLGDCVIESKVGTVDLGVRAQFCEIERGFFDRAGEGPEPAASADPKMVYATQEAAAGGGQT